MRDGTTARHPRADGRPVQTVGRVSLVAFDFADFVLPLANAIRTRCPVLLQAPSALLDGRRDELDPTVELDELARPRLRQPVHQAAMVRELWTRGQSFGADVVHVQQGQLWFNLSMLGRRRLPLVVTVHDPAPHAGDLPSARTPRVLQTIPMRRADHVIVHSAAVRERMRIGFGLSPDCLTTIPLTIPTVKHRSAAPRPPGHRPTVLFFGRIWPYKGLDQLIAAEAALGAVVPDVRIVIAGEGEGWSRYEPQVGDPGRYDLRIRRIGLDERDALFRDADVVVAPYTDATQSGVVSLAHAHGRAVVATRVGALAEQVVDGETGVLVPPRDPAALARAVARLLTDTVECERLGAAGRRRLERDADPSVVADATLDAYARASRRFWGQPCGR